MAKHSSTAPVSLWGNISFALLFFVIAGLYILAMLGTVEAGKDVSSTWNQTITATTAPEWEKPG